MTPHIHNFRPLEKKREGLDALLQAFGQIANNNQFDFSLIDGSLIGAKRGVPCGYTSYVPYDHDVDLMIGRDIFIG